MRLYLCRFIFVLIRKLSKRIIYFNLPFLLTCFLFYFIGGIYFTNYYSHQESYSPDISEEKSTNWLILDSVNFNASYCEQYPNWIILVIGHKLNFTAKGVRANCLSWSEVSPHSEASKWNLLEIQKAFLYAIMNGASYIHAPTSDLFIPYILEETAPLIGPSRNGFHMFSNATNFFNAGDHFICRVEKTKNCMRNFDLCSSPPPSIIVPAAKGSSYQNPRECISNSFPVVLKPNIYTNANWELSIFGRLSFWAFPLFRGYGTLRTATQVVRSCLFQHFLWKFGGVVQVYWEESLVSFPSSSDSLNCRKMVSAIKNCNSDLLHCLVSTSRPFLPSDEWSLFKTWIGVLEGMDYGTSSSYLEITKCSSIAINYAEHCKIANDYYRKTVMPFPNSLVIKQSYIKTCKGELESLQNVNPEKPWFQDPEILLLIVFNKAHYEVIPYLEIMYRPFFPKVIYCGPEPLNTSARPELRDYLLSFITFDLKPAGQADGSLNYQCILKVLQMNFEVDGFLSIGDDVLILNHQKLPLDGSYFYFTPFKEAKIADLSTMRECILGSCDFVVRWTWWSDYRNQSLEVLDKLEVLSKKSRRLGQFRTTLERLTMGRSRLIGGYSDVFYVPRALSRDFLEVGQLFLESEVFLEIAIPSIIWGLSFLTTVQPLEGLQLWEEPARTRPWLHFRKLDLFDKFYYHPTKWSPLAGKEISGLMETNCSSLIGRRKVSCTGRRTIMQNVSLETQSFFCDSVLPYLYDPSWDLPGDDSSNSIH